MHRLFLTFGLNILCCPVLKPQMTGEPIFPGEESVKVSVVQSPTAAPTVVEPAAASIVVPAWGPPMLKV